MLHVIILEKKLKFYLALIIIVIYYKFSKECVNVCVSLYKCKVVMMSHSRV